MVTVLAFSHTLFHYEGEGLRNIMSCCEDVSSSIYKEAEMLIEKHCLSNILQKYGETQIVGSFYMDIMTWRDLDFFVNSCNMAQKDFFSLGYDLSNSLKPYKMNFRNELVWKTPNMPKGYYWGVYLKEELSDWKIDVWAVNDDEFHLVVKEAKDLKSRITEEKRKIILNIKYNVCYHQKYRKDFGSTTIYDSVLNSGVKNFNEFRSWLKDSKNIDI